MNDFETSYAIYITDLCKNNSVEVCDGFYNAYNDFIKETDADMSRDYKTFFNWISLNNGEGERTWRKDIFFESSQPAQYWQWFRTNEIIWIIREMI